MTSNTIIVLVFLAIVPETKSRPRTEHYNHHRSYGRALDELAYNARSYNDRADPYLYLKKLRHQDAVCNDGSRAG